MEHPARGGESTLLFQFFLRAVCRIGSEPLLVVQEIHLSCVNPLDLMVSSAWAADRL